MSCCGTNHRFLAVPETSSPDERHARPRNLRPREIPLWTNPWLGVACICLWPLAFAGQARCQEKQAAPTNQSRSERDEQLTMPANKAVALVDGIAISASQLDAAVEPQLLPLRRQEYQIKVAAIEKLIEQHLLTSKARSKGVTSETLLREEVDSTIAEPSEAELLSYYLAQRGGFQAPFEEVRAELQETLKQAKIQYARKEYTDRLRSEADVLVLLNPPRVSVAYDPRRLRSDPQAPVVILEFSDFQCPYCRQEEPILKDILAKYGTRVALGYRDFPVTELHPLAEQGAEGSRCAGEQGKYWEFHDLLMQGKLDVVSLEQYANDLKLDKSRFESCLINRKYREAIENDHRVGERVGVTGTPALFINGIPLGGAESEDTLSRIIDQELARKNSPVSSSRRLTQQLNPN
jgi:protein-disulfide isomerase